jgi:glycerophosphoryl diester phosphodiesterase
MLGLFLLFLLFFACTSQQEPTPESDLEDTQVQLEGTEVQVIAHRGARSLAPENTLAAAVKAFNAGADGWELDVAMSADGVLVLLHDNTLERTTNAVQVFPDRNPWAVYEFTIEELNQLDFGSWFVESDPFEQAAQSQIADAELETYVGLPVTTLREAMQYTKDNNWWANIEIKVTSRIEADSVIVSKVVALVEELGMQDQVLISSFNHDYLRQVKTLNTMIATGALTKKVVLDPVALLEELDAQAFHPEKKVTFAQQVHALREAGFSVYVWTVNEEADVIGFQEMGVTGIITDFPSRVIESLRE